MSEAEKGRAFERHAQTALVVVIVALLSWMGATTQQNAVRLAAVSAQLSTVRVNVRADDDDLDQIEERLARVEAELAVLVELTRRAETSRPDS